MLMQIHLCIQVKLPSFHFKDKLEALLGDLDKNSILRTCF